jgi:hypothetical protein
MEELAIPLEDYKLIIDSWRKQRDTLQSKLDEAVDAFDKIGKTTSQKHIAELAYSEMAKIAIGDSRNFSAKEYKKLKSEKVYSREEILAMPAGPQIDILVAEKVMGLVPCDNWYLREVTSIGGIYVRENDSCGHVNGCYPAQNPAKYSTNNSAAGQVVEKLHELGYNMELYRAGHKNSEWSVSIGSLTSVETESFSLAVCRAALLLVKRK